MNMLSYRRSWGASDGARTTSPIASRLTHHLVCCSDHKQAALPTLTSNSLIMRARWAAGGVWPWVPGSPRPRPGCDLLTLTELSEKCGFTPLILLVLNNCWSPTPAFILPFLCSHSRAKVGGPSQGHPGGRDKAAVNGEWQVS